MLEQAYILHARKYRNTSLILNLLTREQGRYSAVVKGARSAGSRLRGRLQPFTPLLIAAVGRGELKTATSIDFPHKPWCLPGEQLLLGLYVNELLYRLLGHFIPVPNIYDAYELLLDGLQNAPAGPPLIRLFELRLLQELGYGINFEHEVTTGACIEADCHYRYVVAEGFHKAPADARDSIRGEDLLGISALQRQPQGLALTKQPQVLDPLVLSASNVADSGVACRPFDSQQLRHITRQSLRALLGDKPVQSRALFRRTGR